ncbi:unnamed protein product [Lepeophtheirus salmonis]|uniref:UBX domain-containing protein 4 n=1 Tax=Lepeophtheirus salmonis TaxID=72036 RepID=A0A7R8CAI4_LEPSM|nr:unnamed protein product [Lepeophtheirus salmonis]CAF2749023.1 unnamed protein product [Lepeophtheirus salmonis]
MGINWYSGTVASAILEAKNRGQAFIVVIYDEKESNDFLSTLETFSNELSAGVCVKYKANSVEARQFGEFYPRPLEAIVILKKIRISIQKGLNLTVDKKSTLQHDQQEQSVTEQVSSNLSEVSTMDKEEKSSNDSKLSRMEIDDEASTSLPVASTSSSTLSLEERVARAKELVKEEQGDLQMKQALEERRREKEAERLAREKVKAQIAQDRADKAKKFRLKEKKSKKMKLERERKAAEEESERDRAVAAVRSKSSRIQFRLPDGRTQTNVFDSEAPLSEVYFYVMNKIQKGFEDFSLSTTLPVKKLDNEEKSATIKALELTPSATIMVLPKSSKSSSPLISSGDFMSYIWMILSPLTFIYDLFQSFLPGSSSSSNDNHLPQGSDTNQSRLNSNNRNTRPQTAYKRRSDGGQVRREGNIARLNNDMDNDDENGTYNGNSTQQM